MVKSHQARGESNRTPKWWRPELWSWADLVPALVLVSSFVSLYLSFLIGKTDLVASPYPMK